MISLSWITPPNSTHLYLGMFYETTQSTITEEAGASFLSRETHPLRTEALIGSTHRLHVRKTIQSLRTNRNYSDPSINPDTVYIPAAMLVEILDSYDDSYVALMPLELRNFPEHAFGRIVVFPDAKATYLQQCTVLQIKRVYVAVRVENILTEQKHS